MRRRVQTCAKILVLCGVSLALLFTSCKSKDVAKPDSTNYSALQVGGWYNDGWERESHAVYMKNKDVFSEVNPFWYNLGTSDGGAGSKVADGSIHERAYVYSPAVISAIKANGDLIIPAISDNASGQINEIIANAVSRKALITNLVETAANRGYDGWDLDFEKGVSSGKADFIVFINELADALKAKKPTLFVDVTIAAIKNSGAESNWIFDLDKLKNAKVRRIKLMAYDQNYDTPGPVGEINWIKDCLNYMVKQRGLPADKVILGIANYAHLYKKNDNGSYVHEPGFQTYDYVMSQPNANHIYQNYTQESVADWKNSNGTYLAHYSDAKSVSARLELVKSFNLKGVCFWVLGKEDPKIYQEIQKVLPGKR